MFVDPAAPERPAAITDATVTGPSAYGARVQFTAPAGTTGGAGHVAGYEVRIARSPIADEASWNAASPVPPAPSAAPCRITGGPADRGADAFYLVLGRGARPRCGRPPRRPLEPGEHDDDGAETRRGSTAASFPRRTGRAWRSRTARPSFRSESTSPWAGHGSGISFLAMYGTPGIRGSRTIPGCPGRKGPWGRTSTFSRRAG